MLPTSWLRARHPSRFSGSAARIRPSRRVVRPVAAAERLEARTLLTAYVVDTLADDPAAGAVATDGKVSLREAITAANTDSAFGDAPAGQGAGGPDAITFDPSLAGGTIVLGGAELAITGDLSISGLGSSQLTLSGNDLSRVFDVGAGAAVSIGRLTVTGGNAGDGNGGGIRNAGTLALSAVVVSGNRAPDGGDGGGIYNLATLTVADSRVTGNEAGFYGGGIYNDIGRATVVNSTVSGNTTAFDGGGIYNFGTLEVSGSTLSGNTAGEDGGGISSFGTLTLANSTLSGNAAAANGGGIHHRDGAAVLRNATVFGNRADTDDDGVGFGGGIWTADEEATFTTLFNTLVAGNVFGPGAGTGAEDISGKAIEAASRNNLIGDAETAGGLTNGTNGNIVGVDWRTVLDPVLRDNGGPTLTHALIPSGRAVNAGSNSEALGTDGQPLATDQRGPSFPRVFAGRVDIGAFESQVPVREDLVGFSLGNWWVGVSDGTKFETQLWAKWVRTGWQQVGNGDFNGDGRADVFGFRNGAWWVGLSTGSSYVATRWAGWAGGQWDQISVADLDGDGKDDALARRAGVGWWAALSTSSSFAAPTRWAVIGGGLPDRWRLADATGDGKADLVERFANGGGERMWVWASDGTKFGPQQDWLNRTTFTSSGDFLFGDFNGDGKQDAFRREGGSSLVVSLSTGGGFTATQWGTFAGDWADVRVGDFDGDGRDDLAARVGGAWNVFLSDGAQFTRSVWDVWVEGGWADVRVGDFDGDGRDDLAGRRNGNWWVALSAGGSFTHSLWGQWRPAFQYIAAAETTGQAEPPTEAAASLAGTGSSSGVGFSSGIDASPTSGLLPGQSLSAAVLVPVPPSAVPPAPADPEPLELFWSQADEDEAFAGRLLS